MRNKAAWLSHINHTHVLIQEQSDCAHTDTSRSLPVTYTNPALGQVLAASPLSPLPPPTLTLHRERQKWPLPSPPRPPPPAPTLTSPALYIGSSTAKPTTSEGLGGGAAALCLPSPAAVAATLPPLFAPPAAATADSPPLVASPRLLPRSVCFGLKGQVGLRLHVGCRATKVRTPAAR